MDYYEELNIDRSATPAQIRQAYKRLARLLHPDHCKDDPTRRLAGIQMQRLNGIVAILKDPLERAAYDRSLAAPSPPGFPRRPVPGRRPWLGWRLWLSVALASCVVAAAVLIHVPRPIAVSTPIPQPAAAATVPVPPAGPPRRVRSHPRASRPPDSNPATPQEPGPDWNEPVTAPVSFALLSSNDPPQTPRPEAPAPAVARAEPAPAAQNRTLAGEWFFIPLPRTQEPGLYPPEYIELRVTENSGLLHGRYRARYHITDRAISPAVAFQFEGRADPDGASLPWSGLGGSRGTITLRLLASGALEVTWVADQIGEGQGLVSGTATLVRKLD